MNDPGAALLRDVLEESRRLGLLGPGSVEAQIEHARSFAAAVPEIPARFLDLGSGGGLPGLVLARAWPDAVGLLLDAGARRVAFLESACRRARHRRTGSRHSRPAPRRPPAGPTSGPRSTWSWPAASAPRRSRPSARSGSWRLGATSPSANHRNPRPDGGRRGLAQLGFGPAEIRRTGASVAMIRLTIPRPTGGPAAPASRRNVRSGAEGRSGSTWNVGRPASRPGDDAETEWRRGRSGTPWAGLADS